MDDLFRPFGRKLVYARECATGVTTCVNTMLEGFITEKHIWSRSAVSELCQLLLFNDNILSIDSMRFAYYIGMSGNPPFNVVVGMVKITQSDYVPVQQHNIEKFNALEKIEDGFAVVQDLLFTLNDNPDLMKHVDPNFTYITKGKQEKNIMDDMAQRKRARTGLTMEKWPSPSGCCQDNKDAELLLDFTTSPIRPKCLVSPPDSVLSNTSSVDSPRKTAASAVASLFA